MEGSEVTDNVLVGIEGPATVRERTLSATFWVTQGFQLLTEVVTVMLVEKRPV